MCVGLIDYVQIVVYKWFNLNLSSFVNHSVYFLNCNNEIKFNILFAFKFLLFNP